MIGSLFGRLARASRTPVWGPLRARGIEPGPALVRVPNAAHAPEFGAVIDRDGSVPAARAGQWTDAVLAELPAVQKTAEGLSFRPPVDTPQIGRAAVFVSRWARFCYAHLLLDAAPGLVELAEDVTLIDHAVLAPPMHRWRLDLLRRVLRDGADRLQVVAAPLLLTTETVQPTAMGVLGAASDASLLSVRQRLLPLGEGGLARPRLYVRPTAESGSRGEAEALLELELEHRGFLTVTPDRMTVGEQIAAFRQASVIVAPTGAALANVLFCTEGAAVVELRGATDERWVERVCKLVGATWREIGTNAPWGGVPALMRALDGG